MIQVLGFFEFLLFCYFAYKTVLNTDKIIDLVVFSYLCQIFNYRFFHTVPLLNIGISLYVNDLLVIFMVLMLFYKKVALQKNSFTYFWILLTFIVFQSLIRGLVQYGLTSEIFADIRKYLFFLVGILYFSYIPFKCNVLNFIKKLDTLFIFISIYIWIGVLGAILGHPIGAYGNVDRPLLADQAIVFAFYCIYKWYNDIIIEKKLHFLSILFTITLIINRFNTTWVALFVAVSLIVLFGRKDINYSKINKKFLFQICLSVIMLLILVIATANTSIFQNIMGNFDKFDSSGNNTFSSRIVLWSNLIDNFSIKDWLIGRPFGGGTGVYYNDDLWQYTIHNGYLELLLRLGAFGLLCVILILYQIIIKSIHQRKLLPLAIIVSCFTYWVGYSITFEIGMVIGLCANLLSVSYKTYQNNFRRI